MGGLVSKPKAPPPPPPIPEPEPLPVPDDEAIRLDKRRKAASRARRSGRASTVLTQQGGAGTTFGGG